MFAARPDPVRRAETARIRERRRGRPGRRSAGRGKGSRPRAAGRGRGPPSRSPPLTRSGNAGRAGSSGQHSAGQRSATGSLTALRRASGGRTDGDDGFMVMTSRSPKRESGPVAMTRRRPDGGSFRVLRGSFSGTGTVCRTEASDWPGGRVPDYARGWVRLASFADGNGTSHLFSLRPPRPPGRREPNGNLPLKPCRGKFGMSDPFRISGSSGLGQDPFSASCAAARRVRAPASSPCPSAGACRPMRSRQRSCLTCPRGPTC